jgi:hypothetical protein
MEWVWEMLRPSNNNPNKWQKADEKEYRKGQMKG